MLREAAISKEVKSIKMTPVSYTHLAAILGPRIGKYGKDGKSKAIPGHSLTIAALGVFILWFGWFGFNPGSQLAAATGIHSWNSFA